MIAAMERLHDDALLAGPAAPCRGARILKANMEVEAAVELAHDLDATGMPYQTAATRRFGSLDAINAGARPR